MTRSLRQHAAVVTVTVPAWSCGSVTTSACQPLRAPLSASLFKQLVINTSRPLPGAHSEWGSGGILSRRLWSPREPRGRERVHVLTEVAGPPRSCHGHPGTSPGAVRGQGYRCGQALELSEGRGTGLWCRSGRETQVSDGVGTGTVSVESLGSGNQIFLARWY